MNEFLAELLRTAVKIGIEYLVAFVAIACLVGLWAVLFSKTGETDDKGD